MRNNSLFKTYVVLFTDLMLFCLTALPALADPDPPDPPPVWPPPNGSPESNPPVSIIDIILDFFHFSD